MWDYKIVKIYPGIISEKQLQKLGNAGWELIAVTSDEGETEYYFKRPITKE